MLTGSDLLHKLKELGDISKSDLVRSCGYVSTKKNGEERLNFTSFYEALLEAKGVSLGANGFAGDSKPGRKLRYVATVQGNGNLLIGKPIQPYSTSKLGTNSRSSLDANKFVWFPLEGVKKTTIDPYRMVLNRF